MAGINYNMTIRDKIKDSGKIPIIETVSGDELLKHFNSKLASNELLLFTKTR